MSIAPIAPRYAWLDALGVEHDLSDPTRNWTDTGRNWMAVTGRIGFGAPPRTFSEYVVPGVPGSRNRQTVIDPRDLTLQMHWDSPDLISLRQLLRRWIGWFTLGPGQLRVYDLAGNRFINCEYASGLELDETRTGGAPNPVSRTIILGLHAPDPYFTDGTTQTVRFTVGAQPNFLPILPLQLASSVVVGEQVAVNLGDVPAYPVWTITGPGGPVTLTNSVTSETWTWGSTLAEGDVLTVDTRPTEATVTLGDGSSGYRFFSGDLWWLPPGTSPVDVTMPDATGASTVTGTYAPLYVSG